MSTYTPDDMFVVLGFTVEIQNAGSGSNVDTAWETCSGGALVIEVADSSVGTDQYHTTTPGHKSVETVTLRGAMTSGRKALCQWINDTVKGQPWKRTVTLKEILKDGTDGKTYNYLDCFPERYVFPALSASGTGNLYEEITIKPVRLELV
jgi:phage tail-like protein